MMYRDHEIQVTSWPDGHPWPDQITFDGKPMVYAQEWRNTPSGKQVIRYWAGQLPKVEIPRLVLLRIQKASTAPPPCQIWKLRKAQGLTQEALAAASGVNVRQIQKIEAGEILTKNITLENAVRLAKALGVQPADLID